MRPIIYSLKGSGTASLNSDTSLLRIVLNDHLGDPYLVFETYALLADTFTMVLADTSDETRYLKKIIPSSVSVQVVDGSVFISTVSYDTVAAGDMDLLIVQQKGYMDSCKVARLNQRIVEEHMYWRAGVTAQSSQFYRERWQPTAPVLPFDGFDYYKGGIFESIGRRTYTYATSSMVPSFDWRNRHGANQPDSPYYDGDANGSGWFTPAKDQEPCSLCYVFAPVGAVEARLNLFYNKHGSNSHPDISISEMDVWSCPFKLNGSCDSFGYQNQSYNRLKDDYRVDCTCLPYIPSNNCSDKCTNANEHEQIKIESEWHVPLNVTPTEDDLKAYLITKGPYTVRLPSFFSSPHYVVLSGFDVGVPNKKVYLNPMDSSDYVIIQDDSPLNGATTLWFKNSWGPDWGVNGFCSTPIPVNQIDLSQIQGPAGKVLWKKHETEQPVCTDEDGDGYYWWGIGETKPESCPTCPAERDCDDNDPNVGPYDANYYCTPLCEFEADNPLVVDQTETWETDRHFRRNVIVKRGNTLTIKNCRVTFAANARLLVEQAATLIIDNATLNAGCNQMWTGIEVLGNSTAQQTPAYQGTLEISNNSVIENALCAIKSPNYDYQPDGGAPYCTTTGAIINVTSCTFKNNKVAVEFMPYAVTTDNVGYFERCTFVTDGTLLSNQTPDYFVKLNGVRTIDFFGCTFTNTRTLSLSNFTGQGNGLYAFDAGFRMQPIKVWGYPMYYPAFTNLNRALYGLDVTHNNGTLIKQANFTNNYRTGYFSGYLGAGSLEFVINQVGVFTPNSPVETEPYGLYLDNCTGYTVEQNAFSSGSSDYFTLGIIANNSGTDNNSIYNNTLHNLYCGILAQNRNRNSDGTTGLSIKCNDFTLCEYDIAVTAGSSGNEMGINKWQGSGQNFATAPAGNTFSHYNTLYGDYSNNCHSLTYYYNNGGNVVNGSAITYVIPEYRTTNVAPSVNPYPYTYSKLVNCPVNYPLEIDEFEEKEEFGLASQESDSLSDLYLSVVDAGNTDSLKQIVQTSFTSEAWQIYQELLNVSPWLSDTVLVASAIKEDVLDAAMLTDVLSANPQAAKSDTVQTTLDARYNLLTEEQRSLIDENLVVLSAKELLEGEISMQMEQRDRHRDNIIRYYTQSNEPSSNDSLLAFLDRDLNPNSKYLKALEQFKNKDWADMNSTLNDIQLSNSLTESETNNHNAFSYLLNLNRRLLQNGKSLLQIDSVQADSLNNLYGITSGMVNAQLRNYLIHSDSLAYYEPVLLPGTGFKKGQIRFYNIAPAMGKPALSIYPSPATNYIIVRYSLADNGFITITGIDGKQYADIKLISPNGSKVIPIGNLSSGVYILSLFSNNNPINQLNFIKTK
jgi:hypothetical protein